MVLTLHGGNRSIQKLRSFHHKSKKMFDIPGKIFLSGILKNDGEDGPLETKQEVESATFAVEKSPVSKIPETAAEPTSASPKERQPPSDMDMMKEKFGKLLLGEDMSGGGKGVSSALALSNAITNLAASIFGEIHKLEPMAPDRRTRWKKEIDWLLSVTDHIVEFVPSKQTSKDGTDMEVMVTRQRKDLLINIPALKKLDAMLIETLDNFGSENKEFWYVKKNANDSDNESTQSRQDDKWWHPVAKVPPNGLSESCRRWLQSQKDSVNQVLKAAMAINAQVLSEMDIPESYIESLPKNGRASLGESIYKNITVEYFDPEQFLSTMDLSAEHKVLDLKDRIEASIVIWKRKMHQKDSRSTWGSAVSLEKRELFEERAETILLIIKQRFPGISQSQLDISKIQFNKDVGQSILESYSRILETLAYTVLSRIEDVLYADAQAQKSSKSSSSGESEEEVEKLNASGSPTSKTLLDFMGWNIDAANFPKDQECYCKGENDTMMVKPNATPKKGTYLERLENCMSGTRSPSGRH
ncbi:hypothetical protein SLEP1_g18491 [Rubroshorea leprosula]|uniref:PRONE domain-containing protein n=1 Tax=Rubroshorea leprosula TaxID=152421 RepID=A0AAV5J5A9_9ROSI|nr:hypothetical protein SLEP1_g18491 [Rubroshorea leprosula]